MSIKTLGLDAHLAHYIHAHSLREHAAQTALRDATRDHPRAVMQISPEQGQLMAFLVKMLNAKRAIEVGVFTGYSALSVALAMPEDGYLLACDISAEFTNIGKPFWTQAGVASRIDLRIAPAIDTLDACLAGGQAGSYDFAFIDADKPNYDHYYERLLKLIRVGGVIAIDNVLWSGKVADVAAADDVETRALQVLNDKIFRDMRIDMSMLPVGDGLTLAMKR